MRSSQRLLALFAGASILAAASSALAAAAPANNDVSEVVVTGSRIIRNGYEAVTPVTVANIEQLRATTPSNIPDALNKLPAFIGSRSPSLINNGMQANSGNFLNLRSFGIVRTLILMDGRRVPATSFENIVDIDTLPQLLVQRVDVVTGGASAVYGSDAVTGVVNFILDSHFNGVKGTVQAGEASRNDDKSWRGGMAGGMDVFGKGHVELSYEHFQSDGIKNEEDRPYGPFDYVEAGAGTAANPYHLVANGRIMDEVGRYFTGGMRFRF